MTALVDALDEGLVAGFGVAACGDGVVDGAGDFVEEQECDHRDGEGHEGEGIDAEVADFELEGIVEEQCDDDEEDRTGDHEPFEDADGEGFDGFHGVSCRRICGLGGGG